MQSLGELIIENGFLSIMDSFFEVTWHFARSGDIKCWMVFGTNQNMRRRRTWHCCMKPHGFPSYIFSYTDEISVYLNISKQETSHMKCPTCWVKFTNIVNHFSPKKTFTTLREKKRINVSILFLSLKQICLFNWWKMENGKRRLCLHPQKKVTTVTRQSSLRKL